MKIITYNIKVMLNDEQTPEADSVEFRLVRAVKNQLTAELYDEKITDYKLIIGGK